MMLKQKDGFSGERAIVLPRLIVQMMEEDPLLAILHITDIGYYPKATHHYRERTTPINQYVYIYCVDGAGWCRVNGHTYELHADQYVILPAGVPHAYGSADGGSWTIYWVHFKGEAAAYYSRDASQPMDIRPSVDSRISNRIQLFENIYYTLQSGFNNDNLRYVSSMFHYYLGTVRYIHQYRETSVDHINDSNMVEVIIHYMKENIEKHITLQDISEFLGYSISHYSAIFKQQTGHSPTAYFNLLKVQSACQMLDDTDMKINQICYKIGIDDAYYFSRLFSKTMGMSPREYRELKKG